MGLGPGAIPPMQLILGNSALKLCETGELRHHVGRWDVREDRFFSRYVMVSSYMSPLRNFFIKFLFSGGLLASFQWLLLLLDQTLRPVWRPRSPLFPDRTAESFLIITLPQFYEQTVFFPLFFWGKIMHSGHLSNVLLMVWGIVSVYMTLQKSCAKLS